MSKKKEEEKGVIELPEGDFHLKIVGARSREGITYVIYASITGNDNSPPIKIGRLPIGVRKLQFS